MLNRHMITRLFLLIMLGINVSCQPPGLNQRIIHRPHNLYTHSLTQSNSNYPEDQQKANHRLEELGISGLPSTCRGFKLKNQFCLECDDDPVPIKRCRSGISAKFITEKYCRHTVTAVKCIDPKSQQSLVLQLRSNPDSRFLVQFDMILETLEIIFRNEIVANKDLQHAKSVLSLVGESKIGLFQVDSIEIDPIQPKISRLLSQHSEHEKLVIIGKLKSGYDHLQAQRLAGQLSSQDALQFLVDLFEISKTDEAIIKIVREVDLQGLNSL